jgi:hypothetical protein
MKQNLKEMKIDFDEPIYIICENASVINISNNLVMHSRIKTHCNQVSFLDGEGCREGGEVGVC